MQETQATITKWCEDTFGEVTSNFNLATRANQEMAELLKCYGEDVNHPKLGEECADIIIVLCRLATILRLNLTFGTLSDNLKLDTEALAEATEEMAYLVKTFLVSNRPSHVRVHMEDCVDGLFRLAKHKGIDLCAEIDAKMEINRSRRWKLDGKGCGQHIPSTDPRTVQD